MNDLGAGLLLRMLSAVPGEVASDFPSLSDVHSGELRLAVSLLRKLEPERAMQVLAAAIRRFFPLELEALGQSTSAADSEVLGWFDGERLSLRASAVEARSPLRWKRLRPELERLVAKTFHAPTADCPSPWALTLRVPVGETILATWIELDRYLSYQQWVEDRGGARLKGGLSVMSVFGITSDTRIDLFGRSEEAAAAEELVKLIEFMRKLLD